MGNLKPVKGNVVANERNDKEDGEGDEAEESGQNRNRGIAAEVPKNRRRVSAFGRHGDDDEPDAVRKGGEEENDAAEDVEIDEAIEGRAGEIPDVQESCRREHDERERVGARRAEGSRGRRGGPTFFVLGERLEEDGDEAAGEDNPRQKLEGVRDPAAAAFVELLQGSTDEGSEERNKPRTEESEERP